MKKFLLVSLFAFVFCFCVPQMTAAQKKDLPENRKDKSETKSIGGKEHEAEIVGVKIGMNVPTALEAVYVNAGRKPGQEKPDAQKFEGRNKKDIRVIYKNLTQGELQIVFAEGKIVREVALKYAKPPTIDDLRLPFTGFIGDDSVINANRPDLPISAVEVGNTTRERGESFDGARFDDRYSIGFTDIQKRQRVWWRDEKTAAGFRIRVQFYAPDKIKDASAKYVVTAIQKVLSVTPNDEAKFLQTFLLTGK